MKYINNKNNIHKHLKLSYLKSSNNSLEITIFTTCSKDLTPFCCRIINVIYMDEP